MKTRHTIIPLALLAGGLLAGTLLVPEAHSGTVVARQMSEKEVQQLVAAALPKWDSDVLSAADGERWSAKLSFQQVARAFGNDVMTDIPRGARRIVDGDRVMRLHPEEGMVRYVHRARRWDPAQGSNRLPDKQTALNIVTKALADLGVPRAELGKLRVDTQGGRDASEKSPEDAREYEMYRVVTVTRRVGQLPVLGSRARVAVNGDGAVQRLRLKWPAFDMPDDLALRSRGEVINQVVSRIMRQDPVPLRPSPGEKERQFVRAKLAYAPIAMTRFTPRRPSGSEETEATTEQTGRDSDDKTPDGPVQFSADKRKAPPRYVPVVLVTVFADPTPYQLVVPVAEVKQ